MAGKGTKKQALAFGDFKVSLAMAKAATSREPKLETVNVAGEKVTSSGGGYGGSRKRAPGVEKAVRIDDETVVRVPDAALDAIVEQSQEEWSTMTVLEVIDYRSVPTERIVGAYWIQPDRGSVDVLASLDAGLRELDRVAVVKWCSSAANGREKIGVIRPRKSDGKRALILNELTFANDFRPADEDATAIDDVDVSARSLEVVCELLRSFGRPHGGEKLIETASDEAVDARLELVDRLVREHQDAALEEALEAGAGEEVADERKVA